MLNNNMGLMPQQQPNPYQVQIGHDVMINEQNQAALGQLGRSKLQCRSLDESRVSHHGSGWSSFTKPMNDLSVVRFPVPFPIFPLVGDNISTSEFKAGRG